MLQAVCGQCTSRKTRVVAPGMITLTCMVGAHINCYVHDSTLTEICRITNENSSRVDLYGQAAHLTVQPFFNSFLQECHSVPLSYATVYRPLSKIPLIVFGHNLIVSVRVACVPDNPNITVSLWFAHVIRVFPFTRSVFSNSKSCYIWKCYVNYNRLGPT